MNDIHFRCYFLNMELHICSIVLCFFFFQAEDGIRDLVRSRGLGDVYKRQNIKNAITNLLKFYLKDGVSMRHF